MKRVAIIVDKSLAGGEAANAAAILMGQVALDCPGVYSDDRIADLSGFEHSGIKYNTIVLKTNKSKLIKFCMMIHESDYHNSVKIIVFTERGKLLNNRFDEYVQIIKSSSLADLLPIAVAVEGEEQVVRVLTNKFSLY